MRWKKYKLYRCYNLRLFIMLLTQNVYAKVKWLIVCEIAMSLLSSACNHYDYIIHTLEFPGHRYRLIAGNNLSCTASGITELCWYLRPAVDNASCTDTSKQQTVPLADICSENLGVWNVKGKGREEMETKAIIVIYYSGWGVGGEGRWAEVSEGRTI